MRIISWNVNGLQACIKKGLYDFMYQADPDIICIQETKTQIKGMNTGMFAEYFQYFSNSAKKGYSGVAVLAKYRPVNVFYDMDDAEIDKEGRMVVLEYETFFLVNVYVPNSRHDLNRYNYRVNWDQKFLEYMDTLLLKNKPLVLCGDFNVAYAQIDVYEGKYNESGFLDVERDGFELLLGKGLIDAYRWLYPDGVAYTWWAPHKEKRKRNEGWRLDYFLVSSSVAGYIEDSFVWKDIRCSDHCPIQLDISLNPADGERTEASVTERAAGRLWNAYDFRSAEERLFEMQKELAEAEIERDRGKRKEIQKQIVQSFEARMLAVRHVGASRTPGVDGVLWKTNYEKVQAALKLGQGDYRSSPTRHVCINDRRGRERYINIPVLYDRAMLRLYSYTLAPIMETRGDRKSFAFRKGRSTMDAHSYLCRELSGKNRPEWVLVGDVEQFYANVSHAWLLQYIPMDKQILREFLSAGYVFQGELFEASDYGIDLGSSLSPILANMILDGLQAHIFRKLYPDGRTDYKNGNLIRFADDIVVTAVTEEVAESLKTVISDFLRGRGLAFNEQKTKVVNIREGFDFLARHYVKVGNAMYITPSDKAVIDFEHKLEQVVGSFKGAQIRFIRHLNKILTGWAGYYRMCDCEEVFKHIDALVDALLLRKMQKLHPRYSVQKLIEKFWYIQADGRRYFILKDQPGARVIHLQDITVYRHYPVRPDYNSYLDRQYLEERIKEHDIRNVVGKWKKIWEAQGGKCYYCGKKILPDELKEVIRIREGDTEMCRYVHSRCATEQFIPYDIDSLDALNIGKIVETAVTPGKRVKCFRYEKLQEYFHEIKRPVFSMTFEEIEHILGFALCDSAYRYNTYWFNDRKYTLARAWMSQGYRIQRLDLKRKKVTFKRADHSTTALTIPDQLLHDKLPKSAVHELETHFNYILDKYGL